MSSLLSFKKTLSKVFLSLVAEYEARYIRLGQLRPNGVHSGLLHPVISYLYIFLSFSKPTLAATLSEHI